MVEEDTGELCRIPTLLACQQNTCLDRHYGLPNVPNSWATNEPSLSMSLCVSQVPGRHETLTQCWFNVGPASATLAQHLSNIGSMFMCKWGSPTYHGLSTDPDSAWHYDECSLNYKLLPLSIAIYLHCLPTWLWSYEIWVVSTAITCRFT